MVVYVLVALWVLVVLGLLAMEMGLGSTLVTVFLMAVVVVAVVKLAEDG